MNGRGGTSAIGTRMHRCSFLSGRSIVGTCESMDDRDEIVSNDLSKSILHDDSLSNNYR